MVALLIIALFCSDGAEREQFGAAIRLSATGDHAKAAQMLVDLAESSPEHNLADDALMKAAQLYEEQLAQPARAAELYELLIERYPRARAARRAERRLELLRRGLGSDDRWANVLGSYQAIMTRYSRGERVRALGEMVQLVEANPEFPLVGEARLWIASGYRIDGWLDEAAIWYRRAREGAEGDLQWRATKALADVALARGEYDDADELYQSLATDTPVREQVVDTSLAKLATLRARARWALVGWAAVALFVLAMAIVLYRSTGGANSALRALIRPPTELIYLVPVAAIWGAVAATSNTLVARATVYILIGGIAVTWLSGSAGAVARARGPVGRWGQIGHAVLAGAAILAICYIAIANERLLDLIGETVKFGPEGT